jgi:two-component system NarL family response regulator
MDGMAITVLLIDDNTLFRDGLAQILRTDGRFQVVGAASRGEEAIAAAGQLHPDLILVDLRMPGMGGVEAIRRIRAHDPKVPIGVLSAVESREDIRSALDAGATGYLLKDSTPADLCRAALALAASQGGAAGAPIVPVPAGREPSASAVLGRLTPREREVLAALASDLPNEAIARQLGISPKTLRNHISSAYQKLHIHDRAQAVIVAVREGLVELPPATPSRLSEQIPHSL